MLPVFAEPSLTVYEKDCTRYPDFIVFRYDLVGLPNTVSNYTMFTLATNDGTETAIAKSWSPGTPEYGRAGDSFAGPPGGLGPYTVTYYEATGPDDPNDATEANIAPLPGGIQVSTTFTCVIVEEDGTPPVISVPEDVTEEATGPDGATVSFEVSAEDDADGPTDVSCDRNSGETFPIGDTVVTCSAEDLVCNAAQESFTVTVQDTTAPDVEITKAVDKKGIETGDSSTTKSQYIQIAFGATDAVGIDKTQCSLDGKAFTSCTSLIVYDK